MAKIAYRVRNWKQYNRALIDRGNLTIWFDEETLTSWYAEKICKRGRNKIYSDRLIETALTIRSLFHLSLRQAQGFIEGLLSMLGLTLEVPCYSTLSRRGSDLQVQLKSIDWTQPIHLVIDATGLKVYGEGEWKVRVHGKDKRRTWRKLHLAINKKTNEITNATMTLANVHDSVETANLLGPVKNIATVSADKGYDNIRAYGPIAACGARAIIPPRSGAALKKKDIRWGDVERNRLVLENHFVGKKTWNKASGYSKRSLVETGIYRYKTIVGDKLRARKFENQKTEIRIGASILNRMTHLGMPKSYKL